MEINKNKWKSFSLNTDKYTFQEEKKSIVKVRLVFSSTTPISSALLSHC